MKVILIAGASASGKTSFAEKLQLALIQAGKSTELLVMDNYFKEIPADREINEYRATTNFDQVTMYEMSLLINHILTLNEGASIPKYQFEFSTNKRTITDTIIQSPEFLIIEGLFAIKLARELPETINKMTAFVETSWYKTILNRRINRDLLIRGRDDLEVMRCEKKFVGPAYFEHIADSMRGIDISIVNDDPIEGLPHPLDKGVNDILLALGLESQVTIDQENTSKPETISYQPGCF